MGDVGALLALASPRATLVGWRARPMSVGERKVQRGRAHDAEGEDYEPRRAMSCRNCIVLLFYPSVTDGSAGRV